MPRSLAICGIGRPNSNTSRTARSRSSSGYFFGAGIAETVPLPRMKSWLGGLRQTRPGSVLDGPERREHLACLDSEVGNLRAALHWAAERGATDRILELAAALVDYWMHRERYPEAADWLLPAVRSSNAACDPALRARALAKLCWPLWALGHRDALLPLLSEAEAIARTLADPATRAQVLYDCAAVTCVSGRPDVAAPVADEAFACAN